LKWLKAITRERSLQTLQINSKTLKEPPSIATFKKVGKSDKKARKDM